MARISNFGWEEGKVVAGKYVVEGKLGGGWEGEVYRVRERGTGVRRALKLFFPHRNPRNATVRRHARKLDKLRHCDIVVHYHHVETVEHEGQKVSCLVSELVEGQPLGDFLRRQRGRRLHAFEALVLVHALAQGIEEIHAEKEYHGDLHEENILILRSGVLFRPRLFDFYPRGGALRVNMQEDIVNLVRILYDCVGGAEHYRSQPKPIKQICCGLRSDLVRRKFPTMTHLRRHLETFSWD